MWYRLRLGPNLRPVSVWTKSTVISDVSENRDAKLGRTERSSQVTYGLSQVILLFCVPQLVLRRTIQDTDGLETIIEQNESNVTSPRRWNPEELNVRC
jgi:hypothetical protein